MAEDHQLQLDLARLRMSLLYWFYGSRYSLRKKQEAATVGALEISCFPLLVSL